MTRTEKRKRYRQVYREQTVQERYWQPIIKRALDRMLVPVYKSLDNLGLNVTLINLDSLIIGTPLGNVLERLYVRSGTIAANSEYGFIMEFYGEELRQEKAFGFNRIWAGLMQTLFTVFGGEKIRGIAQSERNRVRAVLNEAAERGLNNYEASVLLRSRDINVARSWLISRTENGIAMNYGSYQGAKRTGVVLDKVWISALDSRTRHMPEDATDHRVMNNVTIPFDNLFTVPGKKGASIMLHPCAEGAPASQVCNCRCRTISVARRDSSGRLIRIPVS